MAHLKQPHNYVVTAKQGTNADLFPDILKLYVPPGSIIADVTFGRGVFWKHVNTSDYSILASDLDYRSNIHLRADFTRLPYKDNFLDAFVLDPPYLYVGGFKTLRNFFGATQEGTSYGNIERATKRKVYGVNAVDALYLKGMMEAYRTLRPNGILIVKCMDQVMSGKQVWGHITYHNFGLQLGFENEDLFILVRDGLPLMRHRPENQIHARRNHSYFLVMRKKVHGHIR